MKAFLASWVRRHRHPVNLVLHGVGIPLSFGGSILALWYGTTAGAVAFFVGGYALQFTGHALEGNDAGEMILFKKLLGKPYTAVARPPRSAVTGEFRCDRRSRHRIAKSVGLTEPGK